MRNTKKRSPQDQRMPYHRKREKEREQKTQTNPRIYWHVVPTWKTLQLLFPLEKLFLGFFLIYPIFILNWDRRHLVCEQLITTMDILYLLYRITACDLCFLFSENGNGRDDNALEKIFKSMSDKLMCKCTISSVLIYKRLCKQHFCANNFDPVLFLWN